MPNLNATSRSVQPAATKVKHLFWRGDKKGAGHFRVRPRADQLLTGQNLPRRNLRHLRRPRPARRRLPVLQPSFNRRYHPPRPTLFDDDPHLAKPRSPGDLGNKFLDLSEHLVIHVPILAYTISRVNRAICTYEQAFCVQRKSQSIPQPLNVAGGSVKQRLLRRVHCHHLRRPLISRRRPRHVNHSAGKKLLHRTACHKIHSRKAKRTEIQPHRSRSDLTTPRGCITL